MGEGGKEGLDRGPRGWLEGYGLGTCQRDARWEGGLWAANWCKLSFQQSPCTVTVRKGEGTPQKSRESSVPAFVIHDQFRCYNKCTAIILPLRFSSNTFFPTPRTPGGEGDVQDLFPNSSLQQLLSSCPDAASRRHVWRIAEHLPCLAAAGQLRTNTLKLLASGELLSTVVSLSLGNVCCRWYLYLHGRSSFCSEMHADM